MCVRTNNALDRNIFTFTWKLWPSPEYFAAIWRAFSAAETAGAEKRGWGWNDRKRNISSNDSIAKG